MQKYAEVCKVVQKFQKYAKVSKGYGKVKIKYKESNGSVPEKHQEEQEEQEGKEE